MILIWFRYDFDMILLWFRYGKFYDFLMVLGCLWFFDMILLWSPGGAGFVAWYALLFAQQGLACGWAYEAISGNTGPLEGGSFPLEPYLVNDVSVFKLWLRRKKLSDRLSRVSPPLGVWRRAEPFQRIRVRFLKK